MANILPDGGRGIGVNPYGSDYPFIAPSNDVKGLLADAYLAHEVRAAVPPLRATRLAGFDAAFAGGDARCDVAIRDAAGLPVFDSTQAGRYASRAFGPRLKVHEWYTAAAVCRVVQHTAFPSAEVARPIPADFAPADGRLDQRVNYLLPRRVRSAAEPESGATAAGDLVFAAGYNVTVEVAQVRRGLRLVNQLTWAAEPGSGLGRYPGCVQPELVLRSFNKVKPAADADFQLGAHGCYWVRRPTDIDPGAVSTAVAATLRLGNDCGPCCECADFVRVQRGVLRTWGRFVAVARDAEAARDAFRAVLDIWAAEKACVEAKVVSISAAPFGGRYVEVVVGICNHSKACLRDVTVALSLAASDAGATSVVADATLISVPGRGTVPYTLTGAWPFYEAYFDAIQSMASGILRFRADLTSAPAGASLTILAAATTAAPHPGVILPQSSTAYVLFGD